MNAAPVCLGLFALLASGAPARAEECPLLRAVYAPIEDEGFGAIQNYEMTHGVKKIPANQAQVVATIRAPADGPPAKMRSYDFGFAFTNGYGGTHIVYSGESAKSAHYKPDKGEDYDSGPGSLIIYFDADLKVVEPLTDAKSKAPTYLIMPEIGSTFWYWQKGDRAFVPSGTMWKLKTCRDK
jgi:hypothetical protein